MGAPSTPGSTGGSPPPGVSPNRIRPILEDLWRATLPEDDPLYAPLPPVRLEQHATSLEQLARWFPAEFAAARDSLATQYGYDPTTGTGGNIDAAVATAFNRIISSFEQSQQNVKTTSTQTTQTSQGITRTGQTEQERTTARRITRFIDLPTPEEFLNDFETGLSTHVQSLRRAGGINQDAADWIMQNPDFFYERYLADLGARAERGEQIFRAVGATGQPVYLGQRVGESVEDITHGIDREQVHERVMTESRDRILEDVTRELTSTTSETEGGTSPGSTTITAELQQQINEETNRRINEETNRLISEAIQFYGTDRTFTIEEVFSRPKLAAVFTVSPIGFLEGQFTPQALQNIASGRRGTRQQQAQTAQGTAPSAPRRLGG